MKSSQVLFEAYRREKCFPAVELKVNYDQLNYILFKCPSLIENKLFFLTSLFGYQNGFYIVLYHIEIVVHRKYPNRTKINPVRKTSCRNI